MLSFFLEAPALAAPGLDDWRQAEPVLRGDTAYAATAMREQIPGILPPIAQRRGSASTLLAVRVAQQSLADCSVAAQHMLSVFASSIGDPDITEQLCRSLSGAPPIASPARFHNSVHNAPAGYWSIATESLQPSTSLAAGDASFCAGLLASAAQAQSELRPVMLVSYDLPYGEPLRQVRTIGGAFAAAMVLTPEKTPYSGLQCHLHYADKQHAETRMQCPEMEAMRLGNPAARALPLLAGLARACSAQLIFPYHEDTALLLECSPC
jgi:hypothetical protein